MTDPTPAVDAANGRTAAKVLRRTLPLAVLLVVLAGLFLYFREAHGNPQPEAPGQQAQPALPVSVVTVLRLLSIGIQS